MSDDNTASAEVNGSEPFTGARGSARRCRDWHDHEWKEEYYGTRCQKCDLFFAHGQAPWDPETEEHFEGIEC